MRRKPLPTSIRGIPYDISFSPHRTNNGTCRGPIGTKPGRITIDSSLTSRPELRFILHEALHACFWDISEEAINQSSDDISRILWDLGYRP